MTVEVGRSDAGTLAPIRSVARTSLPTNTFAFAVALASVDAESAPA